MDLTKVLFISVLLSRLFRGLYCQDPITLSIIAGVVSTAYYYLTADTKTEPVRKVFKTIGQKIGLYEGCEDYWIPGNLRALEVELENVFGQKLAVDMILGALRRHLDKSKIREKPLVLSFHGTPGTGKSFISEMIIKNMFRLGHKTEYVKFFRGSKNFPLQKNVEEYKNNLINMIKETVYECNRPVFVFDEIDKMPNGVLDVIREFINVKQHGDYDYRRVIFIIVSNIGGEMLVRETVRHYEEGGSREEIDTNDLVNKLMRTAYNTNGGFFQSKIIKNMDVSYFVPFLPLEEYHVIQCLKRDVKVEGQIFSYELAEQVLRDLPFGPPPKNLFANGGCKNVPEKISALVEREMRRQSKSRLN